MDRANQFIQLYNATADYLRDVSGHDGGDNFSELVDRAAQVSAAVRKEAGNLKAYGRLRNAIIHFKNYPEEIIAEPTEETLGRFKAIVRKVLSPKGLVPTFQKTIRCFSPEDTLVSALQYMCDNDYSQVVLRKGNSLSLLTTEGVTSWLARRAQDGSIDIQVATIGDADACETCQNFMIIDQNKSIYDAHEAFASALERQQPRLFAIIITHNGRPTDTPIGIVTPWDLLGEED
jgi:hypothetical protein